MVYDSRYHHLQCEVHETREDGDSYGVSIPLSDDTRALAGIPRACLLEWMMLTTGKALARRLRVAEAPITFSDLSIAVHGMIDVLPARALRPGKSTTTFVKMMWLMDALRIPENPYGAVPGVVDTYLEYTPKLYTISTRSLGTAYEYTWLLRWPVMPFSVVHRHPTKAEAEARLRTEATHDI